MSSMVLRFVLALVAHIRVLHGTLDPTGEQSACPDHRILEGEPDRMHTVLLQTHRGMSSTMGAEEEPELTSVSHAEAARAASSKAEKMVLLDAQRSHMTATPVAPVKTEKAPALVGVNMKGNVSQTTKRQEPVPLKLHHSLLVDIEGMRFAGIEGQGLVASKLAALASVAVASTWGFIQISSKAKGGSSGSAGIERSMLLDNAKVCALFFVILGHFCWYNASGEFKAQQAWLSDANPMLGTILSAVGPLKLPVLCFISGICSQGETTPGRLRRFFIFLVAPTCIWIFFVKPVIYDTLVDGSFGKFYGRFVEAVQFNTFHEEWYLQALIFWRGSVFLMWNNLQPSLALVGMLFVSFAGGYIHFAEGPSTLFKIDETLGFLPYFAVGYVFPYERALKIAGRPSAWSSAIAAVLVILYTAFVIPYFFAGQLPNGHGPYGAGEDKPAWDEASQNVLEHRLYWCRRLAKTFLDMVATLVWMFMVLPRGSTSLSWIGEHTLYPYVWHLCMLTWWNNFLALFSLPVVSSTLGHSAVIFLNTLVALAALAIFSCWPWRTLFAWCFHPTWLQVLSGDRKSLTEPKPEKSPSLPDSRAQVPFREPAASASLNQAGVSAMPKVRTPPGGGKGDRPPNDSGSESSLKDRTPSVSAMSEAQSRVSSVSSFKSHIRLPTMGESKGFAKYLMPMCILSTLSTISMFFTLVGIKTAIAILQMIPLWFFILTVVSSMSLRTAFIYGYHFWRLWKNMGPPSPLPPGAEPMLHVCVVVEYKEPLEVLTRTVGSIAKQTNLSRKPVLVIATEARDPERHETCRALREQCGDRIEEFIMTEHTLQPGESVGKHSNENQAVREVWNLFVEERCHDPFEILVTIIDADSLLCDNYLGHVEECYHEMPDGRRLIYNGPLNTYRNLGECNLIVQYMEIMRCHLDVFHNPIAPYHPQSNYSMTLGLAQEIGFWMPDCISEDLKCHVKSLANNFGSQTTVSVPAFICNDSVTGFSDRYVQAKRHQWGSVEEAPWHMQLAYDSPLNFRLWYQIYADEASRQGSLFRVSAAIASNVMFYSFLIYILMYEPMLLLDPHILVLEIIYVVDRSVFWGAEMVLQSTVINRLFPEVNWPSWCETATLMIFDWIFADVCGWIFCIGATLDCLYHITFKSHFLTYVNAPKA